MACSIYALGMFGDSGYIYIRVVTLINMHHTRIKAYFHRALSQHGMPHLSSCVIITHSSHLWLGRLCGFVDARLRIGSDTREIEVGARREFEGMGCHLPDPLVGRC
ncbi:hypothetical protein HOY82DRAFT_581702 [Tuber indicum]|nr:hypothetical protein HOY82DRAFT_581702 [Tuber indicum]